MAQANEQCSLDEEIPRAVVKSTCRFFISLKMGTDFTIQFSDGRPDVLFNSHLFPETEFWNSKFSPNFREQSKLTVDKTWNFAALMATLNDYCNRNDLSAVKYPAYVPTIQTFPDVYHIAKMVGDEVLMQRIEDYVTCCTSIEILKDGKLKNNTYNQTLNAIDEGLEGSYSGRTFIIPNASLVKKFNCELFNDVFKGHVFKFNHITPIYVAGNCIYGVNHNFIPHYCDCETSDCTRQTDIISKFLVKKVHAMVIVEILDFFRIHMPSYKLTIGVLYKSVIDDLKKLDKETLAFLEDAANAVYKI
jgi:hypothetical protein